MPDIYDSFDTTLSVDLSSHYPDIPATSSGWTKIISVLNGSDNSSIILNVDKDHDDLRAALSATNRGALYRSNDLITSNNYTVSAEYAKADSSQRFSILAARIQESGDMYAFEWSTGATGYGRLYVRQAGVWYTIGAPTPGINEGSIVSLQVYDDQISVIVNYLGSQTYLLNEIDSTITQAGHAGIGMGGVIEATGDLRNQAVDEFKVFTGSTIPLPQCNDGLDNDNDGGIDFPGGDAQCTDFTDNSEAF